MVLRHISVDTTRETRVNGNIAQRLCGIENTQSTFGNISSQVGALSNSSSLLSSLRDMSKLAQIIVSTNIQESCLEGDRSRLAPNLHKQCSLSQRCMRATLDRNKFHVCAARHIHVLCTSAENEELSRHCLHDSFVRLCPTPRHRRTWFSIR